MTGNLQPQRYLSKKMILTSSIAALTALFILEINRIYSPLASIEEVFIRNSLLIVIFLLPTIYFGLRSIIHKTLLEMIVQGIIFSILSWLLLGIYAFFYLFIISILFSSELTLFVFDAFIPLAALFFIFFLISGFSAVIIRITFNQTDS